MSVPCGCGVEVAAELAGVVMRLVCQDVACCGEDGVARACRRGVLALGPPCVCVETCQ